MRPRVSSMVMWRQRWQRGALLVCNPIRKPLLPLSLGGAAMLLRRIRPEWATRTSRMGHTHVSRLLGRQPVGSAQAASSQASDHSQEVADVILHEGLPHVPKSLKVGGHHVGTAPGGGRRREGGSTVGGGARWWRRCSGC